MPTQPPSRPAARESEDDAGIEPASASGQPAVSLAGLGIAGLSRRRVGIAVTALVALWIVIGFAGQASGMIHEIKPAGEVLLDMVEQAADILTHKLPESVHAE